MGLEMPRQGFHVFIPPARDIQDDCRVLRKLARAADQLRHGVRRLQRADDSLRAREGACGVDSRRIAGRGVLCASAIGQPGMLRPYGGIIETR